jgi:Uri superfamily endonuclease
MKTYALSVAEASSPLVIGKPHRTGQFTPAAKGTASMVTGTVFRCDCTDTVAIGRLGPMQLCPDWYIYVGSAFGPCGLRARIGHHQRTAERPRWHLDYLRARLSISGVWYCGFRCEHEWAARIAAMRGATVVLPGFGSSDCRCETHLYWFDRCPLAVAARRALGPATYCRM